MLAWDDFGRLIRLVGDDGYPLHYGWIQKEDKYYIYVGIKEVSLHFVGTYPCSSIEEVDKKLNELIELMNDVLECLGYEITASISTN